MKKMNFIDGLKKVSFQQEFCQTLYDLLFGAGALEARFTPFCHALTEIGSPKWMVAIYFPFIMYTDKYMFMKPLVTSKAANI